MAGPLNPGLPALKTPPDLETPQASLENFVLSCKNGDYLRAAWSLDLGNIPRHAQKDLGPKYARMLMTVMEQKSWARLDLHPRPTRRRAGRRGDGHPLGPHPSLRKPPHPRPQAGKTQTSANATSSSGSNASAPRAPHPSGSCHAAPSSMPPHFTPPTARPSLNKNCPNGSKPASFLASRSGNGSASFSFSSSEAPSAGASRR